MTPTYPCDVLIVGGGGAGALAAIHAANMGAKVMIVEKGVFGKSGCTILGGYSCNVALGFADSRDTPRVHFEDTVREGKFINDQALVDIYTREAPARVRELYEYGAKWEKIDGNFAQGAMPGSTYPRAVFVDHRTGQAMMGALRREVYRHKNIRVAHETAVTRLLLRDGSVVGASAMRLRNSQPVAFAAKATVIATGGGCLLYPYSTTSIDNTGDGFVLALEAGAELQDMEFVQFYPTVQCYPRLLGMNPTCPAWFRIRSQAQIYNAQGKAFVEEAIPDWQLKATRDILAQLIYREIIEGRGTPHGGVYIDVSHLPSQQVERDFAFGGFLRKLLGMGIDIRRQAIETGVAAHYFMGGIKINWRCETRVPGLFAGGEATAGVDGSNRLGGNALSEILVFGARAGDSAAEYASQLPGSPSLERQKTVEPLPGVRTDGKNGMRPAQLKRAIQRIMWEKVGVLREGGKLSEAKRELERLERDEIPKLTIDSDLKVYNRELLDSIEVRRMVVLAQVIAAAAEMRRETRGAQMREDYPQRDDKNWLANLVASKQKEGISIRKVPVTCDTLQPEER